MATRIEAGDSQLARSASKGSVTREGIPHDRVFQGFVRFGGRAARSVVAVIQKTDGRAWESTGHSVFRSGLRRAPGRDLGSIRKDEVAGLR